MTYYYKDISFLLNDVEIIGDKNAIQFNNFNPIFEANDKTLSWLNPSRKDKIQLLNETQSCIVVIHPKDVNLNLGKIYLVADNPKLVFLRIVNALCSEKIKSGIHPTAIVSEEAVISKSAYIGPYCVIENVRIGENVIINSHCLIKSNTIINNGVVIQSNVKIGTDGFGYSRNANNELERFPHIGGVIIGDNVEIGCNTCIDKGSLGNTIINKGCKIDNLVHIAHNVIIGENSVVIANSLIGGSTIIGNNCWIAPSATIRDALKIGNNVTIGMGAVVTKDVPDGEIWTGNPAKSLDDLKSFNNRLKYLLG